MRLAEPDQMTQVGEEGDKGVCKGQLDVDWLYAVSLDYVSDDPPSRSCEGRHWAETWMAGHPVGWLNHHVLCTRYRAPDKHLMEPHEV